MRRPSQSLTPYGYASASDVTWSRAEKAVARRAYGAALERELREVMEDARQRASRIRHPSDVWDLEQFLTQRRKEIDRKYQFRASHLTQVLGRLLHENRISERELPGLQDDKLKSMRSFAKRCIALALCRPLILLLLSGCLAWPQEHRIPPIIDMHLHAYRVADFGVGVGRTPAVCSTNEEIVWYGWDPRNPFKIGSAGSCAGTMLTGSKTDEDLMRQTLAMLKRYNIRAVTSGDSGDLEQVSKWRTASSDRIIPAASFLQPGHDPQGRPLYRSISELRRLVAEGNIAVFAEVAPQYEGMSPADPLLDPYFALAEELDIPVGLHMGEGPPGGPNVEGYSRYRVRMGNPLLLEDVLIRHPKLRIYVMHYGSPFVDDMIGLLYSYPQVYVDVAGDDWESPRKHFHSQLRRLVEAGFARRFFSDRTR